MTDTPRDPRAKYDYDFTQRMRDDLVAAGVTELWTPEQVDAYLADKSGTKVLFYNSVCGCAAGGARPALLMSLQNEVVPDAIASVFAGMEVSATERAREHFPEVPGTSPALALVKDGELVYWLPRHAIEGRMPQEIAAEIVEAYNRFCVKATA